MVSCDRNRCQKPKFWLHSNNLGGHGVLHLNLKQYQFKRDFDNDSFRPSNKILSQRSNTKAVYQATSQRVDATGERGTEVSFSRKTPPSKVALKDMTSDPLGKALGVRALTFDFGSMLQRKCLASPVEACVQSCLSGNQANIVI